MSTEGKSLGKEVF